MLKKKKKKFDYLDNMAAKILVIQSRKNIYWYLKTSLFLL